MSDQPLDLDALTEIVDAPLYYGIGRDTLRALIAAARERDQQFTLAQHALGALENADEVLNQAAGLDAEHAHDLDYRDEVVLGLRAERDAARAEVKALTAALNIESTNYMNEVARADRAVADLDAARAVAKVCDCWKRDTRAALDADPTP